MNMYVTKKDFETSFTGWSFIVGSLLLWLGWMIMPHHIGEYIEASDFTEIGKNVWFWIWMYRVHIFGWVTMGIAIFSLVSITAIRPHRVLIIPGAGMIIIGTFTLAIALVSLKVTVALLPTTLLIDLIKFSSVNDGNNFLTAAKIATLLVA